MRQADNDNDELSFTRLGLAAALVINRLRTQKQIDDASESEPGRNADQCDRAENLRAQLKVG